MNFFKQPTKSTTTYGFVILLTALCFTIFALWLPFGFSLTGLIEEWGILRVYTQTGLFFIADLTSPLAAHALRPLTIFPQSLAYFLDNNSFHYWHILLMLSLLVKGLSTGYLIKKITNSLPYAFLTAILVVLYPADTMQITFRALHINWSLALILLATCLFLAAVESPRRITYLIYSILASALMLSALCLYEVALPLLALPFLILYVKSGFKRVVRELSSKKLLIACWVIGLGLYLLYAYYVSAKIVTYQRGVVGETKSYQLFALYYPRLFSIGALRAIMGGWFDAFRILFHELSYYAYFYLILITAGVFGLFKCVNISSVVPTKTICIRLAVVGFVLILLGYLPYIFLVSHMAISQRTFLFASPGAAILWIALFMLVAQWSKKIAFIMSFTLIYIGLAAQLFQFHHYVKISMTQRSLLKNIVANYDGNTEKTLVIVDKSNQLNQTWMLPNLKDALIYFYGHTIKPIEICLSPGNGWQLPDTIRRPGACIENKDSWIFRYPEVVTWQDVVSSPKMPERIMSKKEVFKLTINQDGTVDADSNLDKYRQQLSNSRSTLALRFRNILADDKWPSYFNSFWKGDLINSYHWRFADWWNLDLPIQGNGWREVEWEVNSFFHHSSAWKTQKKATLQFKLKPSATPYRLHVQLAQIMNEPIRNSIKININKHPVVFHWLNYDELEALVPTIDLLTGINVIGFNSKIDVKAYGLSFKLVSIDLLPVKSPDTI